MSESLALRWDLLESQPPVGDRLTARLALPDSSRDVFIAVDSACRRFVLVQLPPGEPRVHHERTSRGISVQTVEMTVNQDSGNELFVEVACHDPSGYAALDIVTCELVAALADGASIGRSRLVQSVLAKWQRFWSGVPRNLMSKEAQLGLFGELYFLSKWLLPSTGVHQSVAMWRGPMGARNDFETVGLSVEVKTSGRVDGSHVVNGLEQLLDSKDCALLLFSLIVREEASATESMPMLVRELRESMSQEHSALVLFESALLAAGYEDAHEAEYEKVRLRVRGQALYRVTGDFPRLTPSFLRGGVPAGISNVTYELRLDAAGAWLLSESPQTASKLLQDLSALG